jgi:hypothetical protein
MASFQQAESGSGQPSVDPDLHDVAHFVHEEFDGRLDSHAVDQCLSQVAARFEDAPVRSFVPLLVGRYAREELRQRLRRT